MAKAFDVFKGGKDRPLDIHDYMVRHPAATFFMRAENAGPVGSGIKAGDMLVVDRSLTPQSDDTIVAAIDGELLLQKYSPKTDLGAEAVLWGVVTGLLRHLS